VLHQQAGNRLFKSILPTDNAVTANTLMLNISVVTFCLVQAALLPFQPAFVKLLLNAHSQGCSPCTVESGIQSEDHVGFTEPCID